MGLVELFSSFITHKKGRKRTHFPLSSDKERKRREKHVCGGVVALFVNELRLKCAALFIH